MFVRAVAEIDASFREVEDGLLRDPAEWVPGLAAGADDRGERLLAEVGFGGTAFRMDKRVEVRLSEPVRFPAKVVLPLSWRATGAPGLFPALDGDLELAPLGPARTQLSLSANYRPPLGKLGGVADRALLHRVAEGTVRDFVDRVAEGLLRRVSVSSEV